MNKKILLWIDIAVLGAILGAGIFYLYPSTTRPPAIGPIACTEEAKQCPDGSYVGRTGSACEFAACPSIPVVVTPASGNITLGVGQKGTVGDFDITFNSFVQDSRCPVDVQCIQAGAVNIKVTFTHGAHTKTTTMPSDEVPQRFDGYQISIIDVAPARESKKEIQSNAYRITFHLVAPSTATTTTTTITPIRKESGMSGLVLLGPTCPVMRNPPDPQCNDKPYQTNLVVTTVDGTRIIKTFSSGVNGRFTFPIAPGVYAIHSAPGENILPRCSSSVDIRVNTGLYTTANVSCDTGIR